MSIGYKEQIENFVKSKFGYGGNNYKVHKIEFEENNVKVTGGHVLPDGGKLHSFYNMPLSEFYNIFSEEETQEHSSLKIFSTVNEYYNKIMGFTDSKVQKIEFVMEKDYYIRVHLYRNISNCTLKTIMDYNIFHDILGENWNVFAKIAASPSIKKSNEEFWSCDSIEIIGDQIHVTNSRNPEMYCIFDFETFNDIFSKEEPPAVVEEDKTSFFETLNSYAHKTFGVSKYWKVQMMEVTPSAVLLQGGDGEQFEKTYHIPMEEFDKIITKK